MTGPIPHENESKGKKGGWMGLNLKQTPRRRCEDGQDGEMEWEEEKDGRNVMSGLLLAQILKHPTARLPRAGASRPLPPTNPPAPPCSAATKSDLLINRHMKMDLTEDRVMIGLPADLYLLTPARLR